MFMGFTLQFYIIFGTYIITGGPARIAVFFGYFSISKKKEYQTESKRNETFGTLIFGTKAIQGTWSASQGSFEEATR